MTPAPLRRCALRAAIALPFPHDVDVAPQLVAVYLARAALAAIHSALEAAHPVLGIPSRPDWDPRLTDTERIAVRVLAAARDLEDLLRDYEALVVHENGDHDELLYPF